MQAGDMVRFRQRAVREDNVIDKTKPPWHVGLLIEYHTWEKIATIMCDGVVHRIASRDVQLHARGVHESR
jgi:hypothetical protein